MTEGWKVLTRDRSVAVVTLFLLQIFTVGAGMAVVKITPKRELSPQPAAVAHRQIIGPPTNDPSPSGSAPAPSGALPDATTLANRLNGPLGTQAGKINGVVIDATSRQTLWEADSGRAA